MNRYSILPIEGTNKLSLGTDSSASHDEAKQGAESPQEPTTEDVECQDLWLNVQQVTHHE